MYRISWLRKFGLFYEETSELGKEKVKVQYFRALFTRFAIGVVIFVLIIFAFDGYQCSNECYKISNEVEYQIMQPVLINEVITAILEICRSSLE